MHIRRNCLVVSVVVQLILGSGLLLILRLDPAVDTSSNGGRRAVEDGVAPPVSHFKTAEGDSRDMDADYDFSDKSNNGVHHHHKPTSPPSSPPTSRTAKDKRGSLPHSKDGFSIHRAIKAFSISSTTDGVAIDEFIDGYTEICKYLESFGVVFSFTMSDVRDKLRILSEYRSSKTGSHYITARGMLDYEIENKITNNKRQASGARTLLRLQRALEFIALLIDHIADAQPEAKAGPLAADAYKETLSKHHEWLVRKAVQLGMKSLSTCGHLIDRMGLSDHEERVKFAKQLVGVIRPLDDQLHKYYEERDLLSLP